MSTCLSLQRQVCSICLKKVSALKEQNILALMIISFITGAAVKASYLDADEISKHQAQIGKGLRLYSCRLRIVYQVTLRAISNSQDVNFIFHIDQ